MDDQPEFTEALCVLMQKLCAKYEPYVRLHLAKVYVLVSAITVITAAGAFLCIRDIVDFGAAAGILALGLLLILHFHNQNLNNFNVRLGMLLAAGFCAGQSLGPTIKHVLAVSPMVMFTAVTGTVITFVSLSVSAILSERGQYLFLGGIVVNMVNTLGFLGLFKLSFQSYLIHVLKLYVGALIMAALIIYNTQNIVEQCRFGNRDIVQHALDLFLGIWSMFRRVLHFLFQKEEILFRGRLRRGCNEVPAHVN